MAGGCGFSGGSMGVWRHAGVISVPSQHFVCAPSRLVQIDPPPARQRTSPRHSGLAAQHCWCHADYCCLGAVSHGSLRARLAVRDTRFRSQESLSRHVFLAEETRKQEKANSFIDSSEPLARSRANLSASVLAPG